jgi:predicted glycosyltransferase
MGEVRDGGPVASAPAATRFLFYSHDGVGLGHIRRNLCVACALAELIPQASILAVTGTEEADLFGIPPGVDLLKLPGLRKVDNGRYAARRLPMRWEEVRSMRARLFTAAVESFRPRDPGPPGRARRSGRGPGRMG